MFTNLAILRRYYLDKWIKKMESKKEKNVTEVAEVIDAEKIVIEDNN